MDNKKTILHVFSQLNSGGAETLIVRLAEYRNNKEVPFMFLLDKTEEGVYDEKVKALGSKLFYIKKFTGINAIRYVASIISFFLSDEGKKIDIVHGHVGSTASIYLLIAKMFGKNTVAHSHNSYSKKFNSKQIVYRLMAYPTRFLADKYVAPSMLAGESRFGRKVVESKEFNILRNGFVIEDFEYNDENRRDIRKKLDISDDAVVIGNVGRMVDAKNQTFFLDVLHKYAEKSEKEVVGLIIGSGPLHQKLVSKASEMNIPVKFISNTAEINKYYSAFDAFIFPSIFEGLGTVVVEAQMAGLNVLMSEAVPNEAVINNELVYVESLDSSIDSWVNRVEDLVLKNANRNQKSAESLRGDGHQYDLKFVNEQLENIYSF